LRKVTVVGVGRSHEKRSKNSKKRGKREDYKHAKRDLKILKECRSVKEYYSTFNSSEVSSIDFSGAWEVTRGNTETGQTPKQDFLCTER